MKLAVYAIAKNEAKHVERWYESVKDADEIVVLDTGSSDGTQALLSKMPRVRLASMVFDPFRFDTARNSALNLVSMDADYCMFIDMDETMEPGTITRIKREMERNPKDMYALRLVFTFDEKRNPLMTYPRECIHRRNLFFWKNPVHELLACHHSDYSYAELPFDVWHEPDVEKSREFYLELLEKALEEDPNNPRNLQYLGREYMYRGDEFSAIMMLKRHITLEPHGPFRSESASYISDCYMRLDGRLEEALDEAEAWALRACAEFNSAREPFCKLALLYFTCGEYESAIGVLRSALRVTQVPQTPMLHEAEYYRAWPYHMLASCYFNTNQIEYARANIHMALELSTHINTALANDVARIMGITNVDQPVALVKPEPEAAADREGSVPAAGSVEAEEVSTGLSEEQASAPVEHKEGEACSRTDEAAQAESN